MAYIGVRRGESLGLKWKHINFKKKTITIEWTRIIKGFVLLRLIEAIVQY